VPFRRRLKRRSRECAAEEPVAERDLEIEVMKEVAAGPSAGVRAVGHGA